VCTLLDTCGSYFGKGKAKTMLDVFLLYLQVRCTALRSHAVVTLTNKGTSPEYECCCVGSATYWPNTPSRSRSILCSRTHSRSVKIIRLELEHSPALTTPAERIYLGAFAGSQALRPNLSFLTDLAEATRQIDLVEQKALAEMARTLPGLHRLADLLTRSHTDD